MSTGLMSPLALILQVFSDQGIVGAGYKINTYVGGSVSTPVATYTDSTLTVQNANPIIMTSAGRLPASIWAPAGTTIKIVITDANNNVIANGTIDNIPLFNDIGSAVFPRTNAEIAAGVIPTSTLYQVGDIRRYGGNINSSDNTSALTQAVSQAAAVSSTDAAEVYIPPGSWNFASVASASVCPLQSGVSIRGAGRDITTLVVTGTNDTAGFFTGTNLSNIRISDLSITGNSVASGFTDGGAVLLQITSAASANCGNYQIDRCGFKNFQATYWLQFFASGTAVQNYGIRGIYVRNCRFTSVLGNAQSYSLITVPAHCIAVLGGYTPAATFQDIEVTGCTADCTYIKGFFIDWGGTKRVNVHHNSVTGSGTYASFNDDTGCYAFMSYQQNHYAITNISSATSAVVTATGHSFSNGDTVVIDQVYDAGYSNGNPGTLMLAVNQQSFTISGVTTNTFTIPLNTTSLSAYSSGGAASNLSRPDEVDYNHNIIDGVRDCGFYLASANHYKIQNNTITGQTSNVETSLLKGAIVAQTSYEGLISGNKFWNCQQGIHCEPIFSTGRVSIVGNEGKDCLANCAYIRVVGCYPNNVTGSVSDSILIANNDLSSDITNGGTNQIGIRIDATNVYGCRKVHVVGNKVDVYAGAFQLNENSTGDSLVYELSITGNRFIAENGTCIALQTTTTPQISLTANDFATGPYFSDTDHVVGTSCNCAIKGNTFTNWPSGTHCWVRIINPAAGSVFRGNSFSGVPTANMISAADTNNLGRTAPNWTGKQGDIVETPLQVEQGSASSKYILNGYWYDATAAAWKQMRTLTGN